MLKTALPVPGIRRNGSFCRGSADGGNRCITQITRVMRLTLVLLTAAFLNVSAKGIAQNVSFSGTNVPLKKVFSVVEQQTGYFISYTNRLLKDARPVSLTVKDLPLDAFLQQLFANQPLRYIIDSRTILLFPRPEQEDGTIAPVPPVRITGRVTDSSGTPMAGASVSIKKLRVSVATNADGEFAITATPGDVLVITYVGYTPREITLSSQNIQQPINIQLFRLATQFELVEVVSNGYQTISRERMTGSYSTVSPKRLESKLQPGLLTALEGQVAGMVVTKEGKIEVRGRSTFLANSDPLIVVDGFPISGGLETINTDNVESITVLKDAVAASIYGARSSNGVIVITTRTARKGRVQLSYKGSTGVTLKPNLSYLNRTPSSEYVDDEIEAYKSNSTNAQNTYDRTATASRVYQLLISRDRGLITDAAMNAELDQLRRNDGIGQIDKYFFRPRVTQQHNLTLTAGNEKNTTTAAVRYVTNNNRLIYDKDNRVIFDMKNDWKPVKSVNVRLFSNINFNSSQNPYRTSDELLGYSATSLIRPYSMIADANGNPQSIPVTRPTLIPQY
ncbi:MAG: carboxypeptidase-like regulatory domain-containing protein, partial [Bacteroidetes bacterium]|nr:carboxypeptidase-like regulatory domain-containing protein [Bacteroidota bacterium]